MSQPIHKTEVKWIGRWIVNVLTRKENTTLGSYHWVISRVEEFSSKEKAIKFCRRYNSTNSL